MDGNNQGRHTERVRHNRDEDPSSDSVCLYNNRHLMYTECDVGGPLRATGGEFGGGSENIVICNRLRLVQPSGNGRSGDNSSSIKSR
jgi:hypothetical protein